VPLFRPSVSGKKLESLMRLCSCVCLPMRGLEACIIASGADDYRQLLTWRHDARQPSRSQLPRTHHAAARRPTWSLLLDFRGLNPTPSCLCYCNDTSEALLLIQACSDPTPVHCNTGFCKMQSPLSSAAVQNRLTTITVSLQIHL